MVHIKKEKKASSNLIIKQKLWTECPPAFPLSVIPFILHFSSQTEHD